MLTDRFNRVINYLRISITDRCDLRCKYCVDRDMPFIPHAEILTYEEILRFIRICAGLGVTKVRLTGGEPLRRKDVAFLLHEIRNTPGIEDISLTTNGLSLGDRVLELKEAGLRRVNISLDTLKRDRFSFITGVDAFDRVLESIRKARDAGLKPVKINTVIIKGFNDDEVLDFVDFASAEGVEVRFIEFMPFGESELWDASKIVTSAELEQLIRATHDIVPSVNSHRGPARMFSLPGTDGKRRPSGIRVPADVVTEKDLLTFLADLFHESAGPGHDRVIREDG